MSTVFRSEADMNSAYIASQPDGVVSLIPENTRFWAGEFYARTHAHTHTLALARTHTDRDTDFPNVLGIN